MGEREWADTVKGVLRNITNISFKQVRDSDKAIKSNTECRCGAEMHRNVF